MRIAIYGKGGSGKSTLASALSVCWARRGLRVLHVGCDPKGDSSLLLTGGVRPHSLLEWLADGVTRPTTAQFIHPGRFGIDCVEAGGPEPGTGCAGRGIARMFELFDELRLLDTGGYDVVVFDVLGDVVCGGFAAPMRLGFAERVLLVVSDEPMSLFAANNMCRAIASHATNRVSLAGLAINAVDGHGTVDVVERFAESVGTTVLGRIPRSAGIVGGEAEYRTAVEGAADPSVVDAVEALASRLLDSAVMPAPRPVEAERLFALLRTGAIAATTERPADLPSMPGSAHTIPAGSRSEGPVPPACRPAAPRSSPAGTPARVLTRDRGVRGGAASRAGVTALLRLVRSDGSPAPVEVIDVRWNGEELRVSLAGPAIGTLVARVREAVAGHPCFVDAGALQVFYDDVPLSPAQARLLQALGRRLQGLDMEGLSRPLREDPEAVAEARVVHARAPGREDDARPSGELTWNRWDHPGFRDTFFFDAERRFRLSREVSVVGGVTVHHASRVCQASEADPSPFATPLFRTPWRGERSQFLRSEGSVCVMSHVGDFDLIAGENGRLAEALDAACAARPGEPIWLNVPCPPFVAGEDFRPTVRAAEERYGVPILVKGIANLSQLNVAAAMLNVHLSRVPPPSVVEGPPRVNLVGFREGRGLEEIRGLLLACGIRVHQVQLPGIRIDRLKDYRDAHLQVLWPEESREATYREVMERLEMPTLRPRAPFGIEGTRRFLREVAAFFGMQEEVDAAIEARLPGLSATMDDLRPRCRRHRLGLVLAPGQHDLLEHPERLCGVPLPEALGEMGFQVDVLRLDRGGDALQPWLASGLSAVYSDLESDPRLQPLGIGRFSLAEFEPGFAGFTRSCRRILARCEAPFQARYRAYMEEG